MDTFSQFELVERRLDLMRRLADALQNGHAALVGENPIAVLTCAAQQEELCRQLVDLNAGVLSAGFASRVCLPKHFTNTTSDNATLNPRWEKLLAEIRQVEIRIRHLQRVHAALLRRMRRTIAIMAHLLEANQLTYAAAGRTAALTRE